MGDRLNDVASAADVEVKRRNRKNIFVALTCAIVAVVTAYCLAIPAVSLSKTAYCGKSEHEHDASCYVDVLQCGYDEAEPDASPLAEYHQHDESCYSLREVLTCGLEEGASASGVTDDAVDEGGVDGAGGKDADSDDAVEGGASGASTVVHTHSDSCYGQVSVLVCGLEESEAADDEVRRGEADAHVHSEACYAQQLDCGVTEHNHDLSCFSNPGADVETATAWESTLPEAADLTGVWAQDLILVAESQLGYAESSNNYMVTDEGSKKGYTRYGAWYGDAYGDWCAMFASFTLHYAGVPEDVFPRDANCQSWIEKLSSDDFQMYYPVGVFAKQADGSTEPHESYQPIPGDLVFFNWDPDPESDHVGIVVELTEASADTPSKIKTIEGNVSDVVAYREYEVSDSSIMGYAALPVKLTEDAAEYAGAGFAASIAPGTTLSYDSKFYQASYDQIWDRGASGNSGKHSVVTFLLSYQGSTGAYKPSNGWTAASDSNYIVAYCCDLNTGVSSNDQYAAYPLNTGLIGDESPRFDEALQGKLSAVVSHAYPFISKSDMLEQLQAANVACGNCSESELITAAQWAIWELTTLNGSLGAAYGTNSCLGGSLVAPPQNNHSGDSANTCCLAIKNYLVGLDSTSCKLAVERCEPLVSVNEDGTCKLEVTITLNRAVSEGESPSLMLEAAEGASSSIALTTGASSAVLALDGLTESQLYSADVSLSGQGSHIQAYYFDSLTQQDLLGGRLESYTLQASYGLGLETTSVAVTKNWADEGESHPDGVSVQLMRDGSAYGESVELTAANNWSYVWEKLPKANATQTGESSYSVVEVALPGYESQLASAEAGSSSVQVWTEVSSLSDGKTYVFKSKIGMLGVVSPSNGKLAWQRAELDDAGSTSKIVRWQASRGEGGGFVLQNEALTNNSKLRLSGNSVTCGGTGSSFVIDDGLLKSTSGMYFTNIDNGVGGTTSSSSAATKFTAYELQAVDVPVVDMAYVLTNTLEKTSVKTTVEWVDLDDPDRPESVKLTLFKNGVEQDEVELSSVDNWSYTWENLRKFDEDGERIEYYVEQEPVEDYVTTGDVTESEDGFEFDFVNTKKRYIMPATGGTGTMAFYATGAALILFASSALFVRRRPKRSGRE